MLQLLAFFSASSWLICLCTINGIHLSLSSKAYYRHIGVANEPTDNDQHRRSSRDIENIDDPNLSKASCTFNYTYTVIIDPGNNSAVDNPDCYPPDNGGVSDVPCHTLDFALNFSGHSSVKFYLASPTATYPLKSAVSFHNEDCIAILGNNETYPSIPTIKCDESKKAGLAFLKSRNIFLKSLTFSQCGALRNSTSKNFSSVHNFTVLCHFRVAVYFSNCTDVQMHHVRVKNSSQATGVVMYNTIGTVIVNDCEFTNNRVDGSNTFYGGGGFAVEFTYCHPGNGGCNDKEYSPVGRNSHNAWYYFLRCKFQNNRALGQSTETISAFILPLNTTHESFGRGGGLSVYFKGDAINNSIIIDNCRFSHNQAVWGGGLLIEMDDNTINNTVIVSHCHFEHNHCNFTEEYGTGGGALRIATTMYFWDFTYKNSNTSGSVIHVTDCHFTQNKAFEGGALSIALARQGKSYPSQTTQISICRCTFQSNLGRIGSAADISLYPFFIEGNLPCVSFSSCRFHNNSVELGYKQKVSHFVGIGAVYVNGIPVDFKGNVTFLNNSGSALAAVGAEVNFAGCTAFFFRNTGNNGAGIALLGVSFLVIGSGTNMNFTDNFVTGYGGAIYNRYIGQENMKSNINCFLRYEDPFVSQKDWNVKFYFKNNSALKLGKSIYSSSILPCSLSRHKIENAHKVFCWNKEQWIYNDSSKCVDEIFTSPRTFKVPLSFNGVYPGRDFDLNITANDDLGHNVTRTTIYSASVYPSQFAEVDPRFVYIADNYVTINGMPGKKITLGIETDSFPQIRIKMNLKMKRCPPGFELRTPKYNEVSLSEIVHYNSHNRSLVCKCMDKNSYRGYLRCYAEEWSSQISTRFWIGFESDESEHMENTDLLMGYFPPVYSLHRKKFHSHVQLSTNSSRTLDEIVCGGEHRTGVLCGKCAEGYAVAVNSPHYECVPCNCTSSTQFVGYLFGYISLTYLPIMVLLFVIFYFNIKLTSSAASGFVLYAQMISSGIFNVTGDKISYVDVGSFPHVMRRMYITVYGIFNLDSFANLLPSFCLNKNFSSLDIICLDYAVAAFPLSVIIVIHLVYRYNLLRCKCARKSRNVLAGNELSSSDTRILCGGNRKETQASGKSLIHTFVAFILLSYTKFSIASMSSLYTTELFNSSGETVAAYRIYLAGHLSLHSYQYLIPYGLLAITVFTFIVLLPPFLLLGPLQFIDWVIEKPGFNRFHKMWPSIAVHTFLDTFQGFYRPNRRFFAGVYFLFRLVMFLSYCFTSTIVQQYTIQQIVTSAMIVLISIFQPYKESFFNHVDTLLFFNLATLNAIALYMIGNNVATFSIEAYAFECVLVWLPLVYMVCYLVWNCVRNSKHYPTITAICLLRYRGRESQPLLCEQAALPNPQQHGLYFELTDSFTDTDNRMFIRAERKNTYHPTATVHKANGRRNGAVKTTVISIVNDTSEASLDDGKKEKSTDQSRKPVTGVLLSDSKVSSVSISL